MPFTHRFLKSTERTVTKTLERAGYYLEVNGRHVGLRKLQRIGYDRTEDFRRFLSRKGKHMIFDVGANNGSSALEFLALFPNSKIVSFEPTPSTFERLTLNAAGYPNIQPVHSALGDSIGTAELKLNRSDQTNSLLANSPEAAQYVAGGRQDAVGEVEVPLTTCDAFAVTHGIDRVDLLKLDVQGFELKVLEGAQRLVKSGRIPLVYLEVSFVRYYEGQPLFDEVYDYLLRSGFKLVGLYGSNSTQNYMISSDALFVRYQ